MDTSPDDLFGDNSVEPSTDAPNVTSDDLDSMLDNAVPDLKTPEPLTEAELQFVTYVHQVFALEGEIISKEAAKSSLLLPEKEYDRLMADDRVRNALDERGVRPPVGNDNNVTSIEEWQLKLKTESLTPQQLIVANTMLDLVDTRSQKKKLQDLNISTATYNMWLRDPAFQNYMRKRAESMLGEQQHEAHLALLDKVRMGDIKAITLYYEMQGIYTQASASQVNANQIAVDVQNLLVSIIEIISDEVDDPMVAARIADRFKSLMTARTIAGELVNNHVGTDGTVLHVPEVVQSPTLTPELQELMQKGGGYE